MINLSKKKKLKLCFCYQMKLKKSKSRPWNSQVGQTANFISSSYFRLSLCSFLVLALSACELSSPRGVLYGSESLRLKPEQIQTNTKLARRGDIEAAHKLWLHYAFAADDEVKADYWKRRYDQLRKNQSR
jgi:hypothetical protein